MNKKIILLLMLSMILCSCNNDTSIANNNTETVLETTQSTDISTVVTTTESITSTENIGVSNDNGEVENFAIPSLNKISQLNITDDTVIYKSNYFQNVDGVVYISRYGYNENQDKLTYIQDTETYKHLPVNIKNVAFCMTDKYIYYTSEVYDDGGICKDNNIYRCDLDGLNMEIIAKDNTNKNFYIINDCLIYQADKCYYMCKSFSSVNKEILSPYTITNITHDNIFIYNLSNQNRMYYNYNIKSKELNRVQTTTYDGFSDNYTYSYSEDDDIIEISDNLGEKVLYTIEIPIEEYFAKYCINDMLYIINSDDTTLYQIDLSKGEIVNEYVLDVSNVTYPSIYYINGKDVYLGCYIDMLNNSNYNLIKCNLENSSVEYVTSWFMS